MKTNSSSDNVNRVTALTWQHAEVQFLSQRLQALIGLYARPQHSTWSLQSVTSRTLCRYDSIEEKIQVYWSHHHVKHSMGYVSVLLEILFTVAYCRPTQSALCLLFTSPTTLTIHTNQQRTSEVMRVKLHSGHHNVQMQTAFRNTIRNNIPKSNRIPKLKTRSPKVKTRLAFSLKEYLIRCYCVVMMLFCIILLWCCILLVTFCRSRSRLWNVVQILEFSVSLSQDSVCNLGIVFPF